MIDDTLNVEPEDFDGFKFADIGRAVRNMDEFIENWKSCKSDDEIGRLVFLCLGIDYCESAIGRARQRAKEKR